MAPVYSSKDQLNLSRPVARSAIFQQQRPVRRTMGGVGCWLAGVSSATEPPAATADLTTQRPASLRPAPPPTLGPQCRPRRRRRAGLTGVTYRRAAADTWRRADSGRSRGAGDSPLKMTALHKPRPGPVQSDVLSPLL